MQNLSLNNRDIKNAVRKVKCNFIMGPVQIPDFLVKYCINVFAILLCHIFNLALRFPRVWKVAKVMPVFKNGDNNDIENYRPIAILSTFFISMFSKFIDSYHTPSGVIQGSIWALFFLLLFNGIFNLLQSKSIYYTFTQMT